MGKKIVSYFAGMPNCSAKQPDDFQLVRSLGALANVVRFVAKSSNTDRQADSVAALRRMGYLFGSCCNLKLCAGRAAIVSSAWEDCLPKFVNPQGRISSINRPKDPTGIKLLQGTLDMLILRTLLFGPAHGHQIAKHIQRTTDDLFQIEHGSLYPALHRCLGAVFHVYCVDRV